MSPTVIVASPAEFSKILTTSSIVFADFYADWCAPCKAISPTYESLSQKYAKPNRITFTKVNVDNHPAIAQQHGVRAMPTFLIFRNGSVIQKVQGADRNGLTTAVENAVKLAGPAKPVFSSVGRTLGSSNPRASLARPYNFQRYIGMIVSFFGLYLISLFSLDAYKAAEESPFNIHSDKRRTGNTYNAGGANLGQKRTVAATRVGKKLGTIADLGKD